MDPIDTVAEAHSGDAMVVSTIRQWTIERRSVALSRLTTLVRASSRRAWRARWPNLSPLAADIAWAESLYGAEIGAALRHRFASNG